MQENRTKSQKFKELAEKRVNKVLNGIRLIENLSNRNIFKFLLNMSCCRETRNKKFSTTFCFYALNNNNTISNAGSIQSKLAIVNEVILRQYNFKSSKPIIC